jgi:glutamine amidotransferase
MIAIVDYGSGNLRSAQKGVEKVGYTAQVTDDPEVILRADAVILPGVGAFKDCYEGLARRGLVDAVKTAARSGKPFLGICVGLQLLFEYSEEGEGSEGLGIFKGKVVRFPQAKEQRLKVPHMGWNELLPCPQKSCPLLKYTSEKPYTYFVHSYYAVPAEDVTLAECEYGVRFPAIVGRDNVFGVQFHPEKSQTEGLNLLRAFCELVPAHDH